MIRSSTRTNRPTPCSRWTRSASIATCPPTCRSAAVGRTCAWWRASRRWPESTRSRRPPPRLRPPLREKGFWRLVSHLSLGHLSVTGGEDGAVALKEVLRLYDLRETAETRTAIEALTGISASAGHSTGAGTHGRVLPRAGCDPGIRSARLAGGRPVPAGFGAGAVPGAARHGQQLHPHSRGFARPAWTCGGLAGTQWHPGAGLSKLQQQARGRCPLDPYQGPAALGTRSVSRVCQ